MSTQHTTERIEHLNTIGIHTLFPSSNKDSGLPDYAVVNIMPTQSFIGWVFGKGTVAWRIWPAVLLHTVFAAAIVTITLKTKYNLAIPNVLITVLGVVIGFVISYRASSGYDRYWAGRSSWAEVLANARTFSRLIWFHVPLRISSSPGQNVNDGEEAERVMKEKMMALDLVEGFVVAVKHHLRGELGIYFEDLYPLVRPLHDHPHHKYHSIFAYPTLNTDVTSSSNAMAANTSSSAVVPAATGLPSAADRNGKKQNPYIPPIDSYGSLQAPPHIQSSIAGEALLGHQTARNPRSVEPSASGRGSRTSSSRSSEREPLLQNVERGSSRVMEQISSELVPFSGVFATLFGWMTSKKKIEHVEAGTSMRKVKRRGKHRPLVAGAGYNIPLEVLRALSEWLAELEARGTVPGASLGSMLGCIERFETTLAALEQVLTTPLPFVYSVHIRTVWIYLFSLPFQLVEAFRWHTIPGVAIAAFIYLGFIAAGEEIEQPFGYDDDDLDLDLFCKAIVGGEIEQLKRTQARHVISANSRGREGPSGAIHDLVNDK